MSHLRATAQQHEDARSNSSSTDSNFLDLLMEIIEEASDSEGVDNDNSWEEEEEEEVEEEEEGQQLAANSGSESSDSFETAVEEEREEDDGNNDDDDNDDDDDDDNNNDDDDDDDDDDDAGRMSEEDFDINEIDNEVLTEATASYFEWMTRLATWLVGTYACEREGRVYSFAQIDYQHGVDESIRRFEWHIIEQEQDPSG